MKKPILLIMAAGMGSRYGGLKQIDPVGAQGEIILDYSLFDARKAGFERAVIIIKRDNEKDFRELVGDRAGRFMEISYAYQDIADIPTGFTVPEGRVKPWGTGHAVLSAGGLIDAPFCAINADDFYGAGAFKMCYDHLTHLRGDGDITMVGYLLKNTLSETGYVARGVCSMDKAGRLTDLHERTHIISTMDGPMMSEDLQTYTRLDPDTVVSMNMWGFPAAMIDRLRASFPVFLKERMPANPMKAEFFLPTVVDEEMQAKRAEVTIHITPDKWYGVTYHEDKQEVMDAIAGMTAQGQYPACLWPEE